jgi:hypothetical protein
MLQSLIMIDILSSASWEKEKEKKRKDNQPGEVFSQGLTCLVGCVAWDFCGF